MKALVLNALGHGFDVEDVEIALPRGREVLVDVQASGLCHTDLLFATHDIALSIVGQKRVLGVNFGSTNAKRDIPMYAKLYLQGRMNLDDGLDAGYFVKPTVFVNVTNGMTIAQEEIFGPVLCVIAYDSEDEAIRIANDSKCGLHAAVLGTDLQRARRVASQIRSGRVVINGMTDDPQAPWGGFKYSGVGREYGRYGIEAFLETRAILES
jgi:hypothetical protein